MANQQEHQKVSITKTIPVYPKLLPPQPHQTQILNLSNIDRKCPTLMYLVLFYKSSPPHQNFSHGSLFNSLKVGLEGVLSSWYPAAGRLILNPSNRKLDLVCNNAGAILVEAVTHMKISELGDFSHYSKVHEELVSKPTFSGNFSDMPLVIAQVTKFGCGGYALGVGTSHSLFDGHATFSFLCAWASKTCGRGVGNVEWVEPVHGRGRLLVGQSQTGSQTNGSSQKMVGRVVAFDHIHQLIEQANYTKCVDPDRRLGVCKFSEMGSPNHEGYVLKTFCVSSAMVENLKRKVIYAKNISACSSFEVVAAHLWKARTKALGLSKGRMVCLQFSVDIRNKMAPALPRGFSGNAYVLASVSSTAAKLEEESIWAIVEKIKEAKRSITDDYVMAYIKALEAPQISLPPLRELTIVSDWTRTPFHTINFGHGNAVYAFPLAPPLVQVAYFMQCPNDMKGIDVRIGLLPQHLRAFSFYFLRELQ